MKRGTIKKFREYLNEKFKDSRKWKNYRYHQRTRGYGDYLYFQDRSMFDANLEEVLSGNREEYKDFLNSL